MLGPRVTFVQFVALALCLTATVAFWRWPTLLVFDGRVLGAAGAMRRSPEAMRHDTGHGGSHAFLAAEFVSALLEDREPVIDVYESLAMTVPGIVAHESSKRGGERLKAPSFDRG